MDLSNLEWVLCKNGIRLQMQLIREYKNGKLFFDQERLCITDVNNTELNSNDIIDLVEEIM